MKRCRIVYTETARTSVRHLPPLIKPAIKALIEKLAGDPCVGKALRDELAGYWSCRFQRWRVIYKMDENQRVIEIHLVEKRSSVYEMLKGISQ